MRLFIVFSLLVTLSGIFINDSFLFLTIPIILYVYYNTRKIKAVGYFTTSLIISLAIPYINSKSINYLLIIIYIISMVFVFLITNYITIQKERIIKSYENRLISFKANTILRKILELAIRDENMTITQSTEKICKVLREYYSIDYCTILLNDARGLNIIATNIEKQFNNHMEEYANKKLQEITNTSNEEAVASIICSDEVLDYPTAAYRSIRYFYLIPLESQGKLLGALMIEDRERKTLESLEDDFFEIVLENIAIVLQNFIYKDKLICDAMIDGLTQVWNRVYLEKRLNEEIDKHRINNCEFSIAILDIDHFKKFNDNYGHLHGDKVLKKVSGFIKNNIREGKDIIARYGGEEFVIVLNRVSNDQIYNKLESIRQGIAQLKIYNEKGIETPITASFGLAEYPTHGLNIKQLIEKSDEALYYSKTNGRNKVTKYSEMIGEETTIL